MLKILINNEEVVCDKQLEIKEEMLSTSSCILNNCYPKSWENTKDYTSEYYYPKDYSKCVIKDEVNVPAEEGEYATGTDLNINVDNTKEWSYQLQGDTQQNTSILPSGYTQVDYIESSGTQYIDSGILPSENIGFEIDFTPHNDMDSTSSARTIFGSRTNYKTNGYQLTTYTTSSLNGGHFLFGTNNTASLIRHSAYMQKDVRCQISFLNGVFKSANGNETNIQGTFSNVNKNIYLFGCIENVPFELSTTTLYRLKFYDNGNLIRNFIPCYRNSDNVVGLYDLVNNVFYTNQGTGAFTYGSVVNIPNPDYPQNINVVTGEQNITISQNGNIQNYPINLGKNLFDTSNLSSQTRVGVTTTFDNSKITFNGTSTAGVIFEKSDLGYKLKPGTYTYHFEEISGDYQNPSDKDLAIFLTNSSSDTAFGNVNLKRTRPYITFTITEETEIYLYMYINDIITFNNWTIGFQIEEGSQATEYAPYFEPIELCKIGDYQDYIYNQNGDWFLHKEIGKVILNGGSNESYAYQNNYRFWLRRSYWTNETVPFNPPQNTLQGLYCNRFVERTRGQTWGGTEGISYDNPNTVDEPIGSTFDIACNSVATTVNDFKTWLSNNPLEVVYILQNPQDTQIADTTLIQQLDNLKNATLYNGVNNINVDGDLPAILNLHYNFVTARIDTTLLFSGVVKNTGNINLNPRYPHYCSLEVLDFKTFLSECEQLDFVINNKTVSEAIEQVVQAVSSYGFVVGNININDDTIIGAYSTQEKTPYDVFQYLADISQSRWYTRLIDENTVAIDFYDPTAMQRGIDLDFSDNTFACQNNIEDLSFNYGTYDYRNKQIMLSNQVFGGVDFEETIIADGYNKIFNTTTPIGILKGITVNGSSATFATNEDKEMGVEADFYYNPGQAQIESNENDGTYPANTIIVVGYTPLVKGRQVISDTTEISRIATQTGRNGTISRYEKRNDVLSSDELELIGNSYLKYKGTPEINLTVVTKDVDLYNIGQIVYFNYPNIEDLSQDYMVKSKKTRIINTATDWNIWYTYTLTSNFNSENAINYFDNQRAKSTGNIQAGDYITRNVDIENSCMIIFSNPTATEITIADNNILNAPLNAPFTQ